MRDVTFLSLGSCTSFGLPMDFPLIYDIMTRSEMTTLRITFQNAIDLAKGFHGYVSSSKPDDNRDFVMEIVTKLSLIHI